MPFAVRQLPGRLGGLVDRTGIPANVSCFNPSRAGPYIYIRASEQEATHTTSRILLYHEPSKRLINVACDIALLPTVNSYQGLEDLRIVWHDERIWFTATSTHASSHMVNELVIGCLSSDASRIERLNVVDIGSRPVKNVVPFVQGTDLVLLDIWKSAIYHLHDEAPADGGVHRLVVSRTQPLAWADGAPGNYRGSTTPLHLHGNTWGCVAHDIIHSSDPSQRLSYLHYWLEMDMSRGVVTFVSTAFWVAHWGVEFVSGIQSFPDGRVTLMLGVQDKHAAVCDTTLHDLRVGK